MDKNDEIRPISIDLDVLPSVHGSSMFTQGETQSLGVLTLGRVVMSKSCVGKCCV